VRDVVWSISYAGGSLAAGRATHSGQVFSEVQDKA